MIKVIGKFKDEAADILTAAFVGLRSKMYSYLLLHTLSKQGIRESDNEDHSFLAVIVQKVLEHVRYPRSHHHQPNITRFHKKIPYLQKAFKNASRK